MHKYCTQLVSIVEDSDECTSTKNSMQSKPNILKCEK